jgi:diphthamide biosynthesis protein 2
MGKPSPAKLGNYLDLDIFVLVACPENSLLDSREFHVPVIAPYEALLALGSTEEWGVGDFQLGLKTVMTKLENQVSIESQENENEDEPYFSLVTGTYKQKSHHQDLAQSDPEPETEPTSKELLPMNDQERGLSVFSTEGRGASAYFTSRRTYKGLELDLGNTPVAKVQQGRKGIASGYSTEPPFSS